MVIFPAEPPTVTFVLRESQLEYRGGGRNVQGDLGLDLARDEALPRFVALVDDLGRVLAVLGLARERELVLGLSVGDLRALTRSAPLPLQLL